MTVTECDWTENADGMLETTCGNAFQCEAGTPPDNGFKFCVYCGGRLIYEAYRENADD